MAKTVGNKNERRRNYFIDKRFQTKFILKFCSLHILASLLTGVFIFLLNRETKTVAFDDLELVVKSTSDFILPILLQILVVVSLFIGAATIGVILLISHQIAGPLYRLTLELNRIKLGDLSVPIHLRTKDQMQKAANESEQMRIALRESVGSMKKSWFAIRAELQVLRSGLTDEKKRQRLDQETASLDAELTRFKTE